MKMAYLLQKERTERTVGEVIHFCLGSKLLCPLSLLLAPQTGDVLCNIQSLTDCGSLMLACCYQ